MDAPICDYVNQYRHSDALRLHMPGHKGVAMLGMEDLDITEIPGADSLYEADGIIQRSEQNASQLFGCPTFYSTEGSSHCIRAMLHLIRLYGGENTCIAAARNVHRSFLSAAALLDLNVQWLYPKEQATYLSCQLNLMDLEEYLIQQRPTALYLTSPDYLGNMADIAAIAQICHRHKVLLAVDNAHGAYLRFINPSAHPMTLGADICCDSAHKTLPVLTGGAYLHISDTAPSILREQAKNALALFGSTSPSYLILQSLDMVNVYLVNGYRFRLKERIRRTQELKVRLIDQGYQLTGDEPMKITLCPKPYGYTGHTLAQLLRERSIVCEYADPDHVVLMITPELEGAALDATEEALLSIPRREPITESPPPFHQCQPELRIRQAALAPCRTVPADHALGRILTSCCVGCPPAVPIAICGERLDLAAIQRFRYYGIHHVTVMNDYAWK